jgi:hypothetical protein
VLEQPPWLAVGLDQVDPAAVRHDGHQRLGQAFDRVLDGLRAGQPADRGEDRHPLALLGGSLERPGGERGEHAARGDDRDPQQMVRAPLVVVPVAAGDGEHQGHRRQRRRGPRATADRERERRQHERRREHDLVARDDVDRGQPRLQQQGRHDPARSPRTATRASPAGEARLTI